MTEGTRETEGDRYLIGARGGCFCNIMSDTWDFLSHGALETKTFSKTLRAYEFSYTS